MEIWQIHAGTVHFPIALAMAAFVFAAMGYIWKSDSLMRASWYCTILAGLTAVATVVAGVITVVQWAPTGDAAKEAREHAGMATETAAALLTQFVWVATLLLKKRTLSRRAATVYTVLALVTMILAVATAFLGGEVSEIFPLRSKLI
jgi:uncharacterized membrane protein